MASTKPIYGQLRLNDKLTLEVVINRLHQVSETFFNHIPFSAYAVMKDGSRKYGLSQKESVNILNEQQPSLKSMVFALGRESGGGLRMELILGNQVGKGEVRYFIATQNPRINEEIRDMLHGVWVKREIDTEAQQKLIGLVSEVLASKSKVYEEKQTSKVEKEAAKPITVSEKLFISPRLSVSRLMEMLNELSVVYFEDAEIKFDISTVEGDYIVKMMPEEVVSFMRFNRNRIHTLQMNIASLNGHGMSLDVGFADIGREANGTLKVYSPDAEPIFTHVSKTIGALEKGEIKREKLVKEFGFDPESFSAKELLAVMNIVQSEYFKTKDIKATYRLKNGKQFNHLSLKSWEQLYEEHLEASDLLSLLVEDKDRRTRFFLNFNWRDDECKGKISLEVGDDDRNQSLKSFVWDKLNLFYPSYDASDGKKEGYMQVKPVFSQRRFVNKTKDCLMIMPLEAYWSDSIWMSIQMSLKASGFQYTNRIPNLSEPGFLEDAWSRMNETDLIIADLTYRQADVFYYLGIAHTLGKKVLMISQHGRDIPLNLEAFPHIIYDNTTRGLQDLAEAIHEFLRS